MQFLDIPHPMSERSPSQTNFVIEEDASDYGDSVQDPKEITNETSFYFVPYWVKLLILGLILLCIGLGITLTVFVILYSDTYAPYEVCRTKSCTRTATLFIRTMDDTIDPCQDFHKFACGNWITDTATVVSVPIYDHTTIMRDRIVGRLRTLTENISMNDIDALHQLKYMYNSCIDLESIEKAGLKPMIDMIKSVINTNMSVARTLATVRRTTGQSYIFDLSVGPDYLNNTYNSVFVDQPELPVAKEILLSSDDIVIAYEYLIRSVVGILNDNGYANELQLLSYMGDNVKTIINYEKQFAMAMSEDLDRSKPRMNNIMTIRQLNLMFSGRNEFGNMKNSNWFNNGAFDVTTPNVTQNQGGTGRPHVHFNWTEYFEVLFDGMGMEINDDFTVVVMDLSYIHALAKVLDKTNRMDIDIYLAWQLMYTLGKDVTSEVRSLFQRFSGKLDGNEATPNRRTACISLLDKTLPFLLTHKYIIKYVNHSVIDEASEIVDNIIKSFKGIVNDLDWMDENTKDRAIFKADHVRKFLGFPAWVTDPFLVQDYYDGLRFRNKAFFKNMVVLLSWLAEKELRTVGQRVDHTWASTSDSPAEADAFYDDEMNAISFPAGFLQEPFIGMGLRATDYGAVGSVIGHELTHGFDTEGRYSDEYGRLNSWWSVETLQRFMQKAKCFEEQYNEYRVPEVFAQLGDNNTVNGKQTLAENIADNGGIREALAAYRFYVTDRGSPEPRLPGLEKYTPDQIFFLAFAQSWCSYQNPSSLVDMLQTNEHSPSRYRIIGPLSNFDEFSKVWSCPAGSQMNPEKKCVLW